MILAVAALLLHSAAIPQVVASSAGSAPLEATAGPASGSVTGSTASGSTSVSSLSPAGPQFDTPRLNSPQFNTTVPEFDASATYTPGSKTLEEVSASFASPSSPVTVIVAPVFPSIEEISGLEPFAVRARTERRRNREWLALAIAQHSAAAFDAWSTRRAVSSGGGVEANPLLRPFAGNGSLYAAIQVGPLALDYVGRRMMHSEHPWMRRTWWAPEALGTALSLGSGIHNLSNVR